MSTKFEKNMEDIFELPEKIEQTKELKPVDNSDETVDNDFKYARENLYNIIERGSDALNTLVDVANQSQHPRAFEVVGQLVKTLSDTNKDLLELQKKVKVIKNLLIEKLLHFKTPILNSLIILFVKLFFVKSCVAKDLTVTANVCIPALPPIDATIGIKKANTTICSIVAPNKLIQ